jgi:hypothetical protein
VRLVSPVLKHVVYPGLSKAGYFRRAWRNELPVLTYHGVLPAGYKVVDRGLDGNLVTIDSFRRQLRFLKDRYNVISPNEFLLWCEAERELPPRSVLLTCDDGLRNSLFDMLPILQQFEMKCLFFVTGASLSHTSTMLWYEELYLMFLRAPENFTLELPGIGPPAGASRPEKRSWWWDLVKRLSQYDGKRRTALLDRVRMQLGLSPRWAAEYRENPVLSRRFLMLNLPELHQLAEAGMGIGAHTFGDSSSVTSREVKMAKRAGFKAAFLNVGGSLGTQTHKFALPRVHITAEMGLAEFEAHISGFHRSLQELVRSGGRSALVGSNA